MQGSQEPSLDTSSLDDDISRLLKLAEGPPSSDSGGKRALVQAREAVAKATATASAAETACDEAVALVVTRSGEDMERRAALLEIVENPQSPGMLTMCAAIFLAVLVALVLTSSLLLTPTNVGYRYVAPNLKSGERLGALERISDADAQWPDFMPSLLTKGAKPKQHRPAAAPSAPSPVHEKAGRGKGRGGGAAAATEAITEASAVTATASSAFAADAEAVAKPAPARAAPAVAAAPAAAAAARATSGASSTGTAARGARTDARTRMRGTQNHTRPEVAPHKRRPQKRDGAN